MHLEQLCHQARLPSSMGIQYVYTAWSAELLDAGKQNSAPDKQLHTNSSTSGGAVPVVRPRPMTAAAAAAHAHVVLSPHAAATALYSQSCRAYRGENSAHLV